MPYVRPPIISFYQFQLTKIFLKGKFSKEMAVVWKLCFWDVACNVLLLITIVPV